MALLKKTSTEGASSSVEASASQDLVTLGQLQVLLENKSSTGHGHEVSDIAGFDEAVEDLIASWFEDGDGIQWDAGGASIKCAPNSGLKLDADGLAIDFGSGAFQVAAGNHTHADLHAAASIASNSLVVTSSGTGQQFYLEVKLVVDGGLAIAAGGLQLNFGTGANQAARGSDVAALQAASHAAVTVANTDTLALTLTGQQVTGAVRLDPSPGVNRGSLASTSAGVAVVLGSGSREAAPGDHQHPMATDGWGGFMSGEDKAKLDQVRAWEPGDTLSVHLELTDEDILLATVLVGQGLIVGPSGVALDLSFTATTSRAGLMSSADKLKLDGISGFEVDDTATINLTFEEGVLAAELKIGTGLIVDGDGVRVNPNYLATQSAPGLLAAADKAKLDALNPSGIANMTVSDTRTVNLTYADGNLKADVIPGPGLLSAADGLQFDLAFIATGDRAGLMSAKDKARWDLTAAGGLNGPGHVICLLDDSIYIGGPFTEFDGVSSPGLVKLDREGKINPLFDIGQGFGGGVDYIDVALSSGVETVVVGSNILTTFQGRDARLVWKLDGEGQLDEAFQPAKVLANIGTNGLVGLKLVAGRVVACTWQTLLVMDQTGAVIVQENGGVNLHGLARDGNALLLSSRAYAHGDTENTFDGTANPKGFKKLQLKDLAQVSAFSTNAGDGADTTCTAIAVAPDRSFYVVGNTLAYEGKTYAWDGDDGERFIGLYKILATGLADPTFEVILELTTGGPPAPFCVADNGDIYVGGPITAINGTAVTPWRLYRLNAAGELIKEYRHFNGRVMDCKWRQGRLYVVGEFTAYGKAPAGRFIILNQNGTAWDCCLGGGGANDMLPQVQFSPPTGANKPLDVELSVPGYVTAQIFYTLDGSEPTDEDTEYTGPISLSGAGMTTIRAIAVKEGYANSPISEAHYAPDVALKLPKVQFFPPLGNVPVEVMLVCAVAGATIYYTTDGSDPTYADTEYTGPFTVSAAGTVKAIAVLDDYEDSDVAEAIYGTWDLINFDTNSTDPTAMEGAAATGIGSGDFWNANPNPFATDIGKLKDANEVETPVRCSVMIEGQVTAAGVGGSPSPALQVGTLRAAAAGYGEGPGLVEYTLRGFPKGEYDLYVYAPPVPHNTRVFVAGSWSTLPDSAKTMRWQHGDPTGLVEGKTVTKFMRLPLDPTPVNPDWEPGIRFGITGTDGYISGWQLKRSAAPSGGGGGIGQPDPTPSDTINVDFCPGTTTKAGKAAAGAPADFWNSFVPGGLNKFLKWANDTNSGVQIGTQHSGTILTGTFAHADAMYGRFYYGLGTSIQFALSPLPVGEYDILVYAHGDAPTKNTVVRAIINNNGVNRFHTGQATISGGGWNASAWQAGVQFVRFRVSITHAVNTVNLITSQLRNWYVNGLQIQRLTTDIIQPAITGKVELAFSGGANKVAGTYRAGYVNGAMKYGVPNFPWRINLDPTRGFKIKHSGSTVISAPGGTDAYNTQEEVEQAAGGAFVDFVHSGGPIKMFLEDLTNYSDNVAGAPTPRFSLMRLE